MRLVLLIEGQQENVALRMLQKAHAEELMPNFKEITSPYVQRGPGKNHKHLPFLVNWYISNNNLDFRNLKYYYDKFIKNPKIHNTPLERFENFQQFEQLVDSTVEPIHTQSDIDLSKIKPHFEDEHVKIYLGDSRPKCVHYGQGKKYGFCISRTDHSNLYNSYRKSGATFYFIYFKNKSVNPPANMIVLHVYKDQLMINYANKNEDHTTTKEEVLNEFPMLSNAFEKLSHKSETDQEKHAYSLARKDITDLKNINDKIMWLEVNAPNKEIKHRDWRYIPKYQWEPLIDKSIELGNHISFYILDEFKSKIPRYLAIQKRYYEENDDLGLADIMRNAVEVKRTDWVNLILKVESDEFLLNLALDHATEIGNMEMMKDLIEKGATDLSEPLKLSIKNKDNESIRYLIDKGAEDVQSVLRYATFYDDLEMIKYLINVRNVDFGSVLIQASENGTDNIAEYIINNGFERIESSDLKAAIYRFAIRKNTKMIKFLVENAKKLNVILTQRDLSDGLITSAQYNNLEAVKYLIQQGSSGISAASQIAERNQNKEVVEYLRGIEELNTSFADAVDFGDFDKMRELAEVGATILDYGLKSVIRADKTDLAKYLISKGARDLNDALKEAALKNNLELVRFLVDKGANRMESAMTYAAMGASYDVAKFLIDNELVRKSHILRGLNALEFSDDKDNGQKVKNLLNQELQKMERRDEHNNLDYT